MCVMTATRLLWPGILRVVNTTPTEYEEQVTLVQYLQLRGYLHFHVPNSTYTTSFNQKRRNRALGVVAGPPDLFIIVRGQLIAIELKRRQGSATSPEQKAWIEALNACGVQAAICKGAEPAIAFIEAVARQV